jgi:restriction-modification system family protein
VAGLSKATIARRLLSYLERGGARVTASSFDVRDARLPWRCVVEASGLRRAFNCYFWTVTHGGKHRSDSEYRIQTLLGNAERRLAFGTGTTLLLGLYDGALDKAGKLIGHAFPNDMQVVVAWDPVRHITLGASSSCQVPAEQLMSAHLIGVASRTRHVRDDIEKVIALRPEYLASYFVEAAGGHDAVDPARLKPHV